MAQQDNLATALKRDPKIISRFMKASLERQGYEIRLREKVAKVREKVAKG